MPVVYVGWMTNQLVGHLANPEAWLKDPAGFDHTHVVDPDDDPTFYTGTVPPPGWQSLPFHEGD